MTEFTLTQDCVDLIKDDEGLRLSPYKDIAGYATIGYGHRVKEHESFGTITPAKAHEILIADTTFVVGKLNGILEMYLTQYEFDALVSLTYNIGWWAFYTSTLLKELKLGQKNKAALQFDKWVYAGGVKVEHLVKRRARDRILFEKGIYAKV